MSFLEARKHGFAGQAAVKQLMKSLKKSAAGNIVTLPASCYHDPAFYERERENIFKSRWLLFCHSSLLGDEGQYFAQDIAGWPLFVIRDKAGELKGFHNVCRHRASQILKTGHGRTPALRCMYHGWVYGTDGCLKKAPGFGGDEEALCRSMSLFPIHVRLWNNLVFICLAEEAPDFNESLGDAPAALSGIDLSSYRFYGTASHALACNWKTYVENYMEGYHIPAVHPGLNKEVDMKTYRVVPGNYTAQHTTEMKKKDALNDGLWLWLWPYAALNIYKDGMNLELMIPTGPETMELRYCYLFKDLAAGAENRKTIEMSFSVTNEDVEICEIVQKNLKAGIYQTGELSPHHEQGVAYFQQLIREHT